MSAPTHPSSPLPEGDKKADDAELVLVEVSAHVAHVTINRPDARNAMNGQVLRRLGAVLTDLRTDDEVHAIILTGSGDKAFVAGADIRDLSQRSTAEGLRATMQRLYDQLAEIEKPTIAAVNGYAFGGGHELALACDIRIASSNAQFALPETGLGIIPAAGGTKRLAQLIGLGRATEMILTGRRLSAEEALSAGLVTDVVAPEELGATASSLAGRILSKGPLAAHLATTVVKHAYTSDHETAMLLERLAQSVLYSVSERSEGTTAFFEKRSPEFPRDDFNGGIPA